MHRAQGASSPSKNQEHNRRFGQAAQRLRGVRSAIDGKDLMTAKALKESLAHRRMASKGIIHRNAAGRYKSRLANRFTSRSAQKSASGANRPAATALHRIAQPPAVRAAREGRQLTV